MIALSFSCSKKKMVAKQVDFLKNTRSYLFSKEDNKKEIKGNRFYTNYHTIEYAD